MKTWQQKNWTALVILSLSNLSRKKKKDCAHFPILNRIYICIRQRWRQNPDFVLCYYFFLTISSSAICSSLNVTMNFHYVVRFEGLPYFLKRQTSCNTMLLQLFYRQEVYVLRLLDHDMINDFGTSICRVNDARRYSFLNFESLFSLAIVFFSLFLCLSPPLFPFSLSIPPLHTLSILSPIFQKLVKKAWYQYILYLSFVFCP